MPTISESLFERLCQECGLQFARVPCEAARTPDYILAVNGREIVVEIKQLDPSKKDKKFLKDCKDWKVASWCEEPGRRVRMHIDKGAPQLKRMAMGRPTLLVLYNNIGGMPLFLEPYQIRVGMFGFETVRVQIPSQPDGSIKVVDRNFGGNRKVGPLRNTSMSAVGVLYNDSRDDSLFMCVYRNLFAAVPLISDGLKQPKIRFFELEEKTPGEWQEWKEI